MRPDLTFRVIKTSAGPGRRGHRGDRPSPWRKASSTGRGARGDERSRAPRRSRALQSPRGPPRGNVRVGRCSSVTTLYLDSMKRMGRPRRFSVISSNGEWRGKRTSHFRAIEVLSSDPRIQHGTSARKWNAMSGAIFASNVFGTSPGSGLGQGWEQARRGERSGPDDERQRTHALVCDS
jgi:hypothetical protein